MTTSTARLALIVASVQRARAGSQRAGEPAQSAGARLRAASRSAWADWVYVPTGSMNPTILGGDRLLFDRHLYGVRVPFSAIHVADGADPARGQLGCISCWATKRDNSAGSRFIGFVPRRNIVGRATRVVLSLNPDRYFLPRPDRVFTTLRRNGPSPWTAGRASRLCTDHAAAGISFPAV